MNLSRCTLLFFVCLVVSHLGSGLFAVSGQKADVCVYGGTASGVMAAIAAKKEGAEVILIEPTRWLGGMTGGGINNLDWGNRDAVGGSTIGFLTGGAEDASSLRNHGEDSETNLYARATRVGLGNKYYREKFKRLTDEHGIKVIFDHRLSKVRLGNGFTIYSSTRQRPSSVTEIISPSSRGQDIYSIFLDYAPVSPTGIPIPEPEKRNNIEIVADVFIDCSYEGDLLAMSGASYTWGRESIDQYGESYAGVRPSLWEYDIDPFLVSGDPESGLIPYVQDRKMGELGSADGLTMSYSFRFAFNRDGQGIPIPQPERYDPFEFEMYRRAFLSSVNIFQEKRMRVSNRMDVRGGRPNITNNNSRHLFANLIFGVSENYPNGDWATRSKIWRHHQEYFSKLIHFLRTDPSVPSQLKTAAENLTFEKGVFDETGGWPSQLYVREARRMISDYVVTQHDLAGETDPTRPIGLASYGIDDWPYAIHEKDGKIALQGGSFSILYVDGGKYDGVFEIPYGAIVPSRDECGNLLVPVCLSASHVAMTAIRMEPVWMVIGESAGIAASVALEEKVRVQDVPYEVLRERLLEANQKLDRTEANF